MFPKKIILKTANFIMFFGIEGIIQEKKSYNTVANVVVFA